MRCPSCQKKAEPGWRFCPNCGGELHRDLFQEIDQEFEEIAKKLMGSFEIFQREPQQGVTMKIRKERNRPPKVSVTPLKKKTDGRADSMRAVEPRTVTKKFGNKLVAELDVPEVKDVQDVEINILENSIEVRAYGKNQLYFKILKIPSGTALTNQQLNSGKLVLEFQKV